jgi:hypothetical protein
VPRTERLKSQEQEVPETNKGAMKYFSKDLLSLRNDENVPSSRKKNFKTTSFCYSILKATMTKRARTG